MSDLAASLVKSCKKSCNVLIFDFILFYIKPLEKFFRKSIKMLNYESPTSFLL